MNQRSLDQVKNFDISASFEALKRAARRARELARQTQTALVISEDGRVKLIKPDEVDAVHPGEAPSSGGSPK